MQNSSPLIAKSYEFTVGVVRLCKQIQRQNHEYDLTRQLIRSSDSVASGIAEAQQAESRKDFVSKFKISMKEAYESRYRLRLLVDTGFVKVEEAKHFLCLIEEVIAMLGTSIKTAKKHQSVL